MSEGAQSWATVAHEFRWDGSLRDIYVLQTDLEDWTAAVRFIAERGYSLSFSGGWVGQEFPRELKRLFTTRLDQEITCLSIEIHGVVVNCHFFSMDEIEFDVDPRQVDGVPRLDALFEFMKGLARSTGKDVILTPEGGRDLVIFRCRPGAESVEHVPADGGK